MPKECICQNPKCKKRFTVRDSYPGKYCSHKCSNIMRPKIWDKEMIKYVLKHLAKDGLEKVAAHLNVKVVTLKRRLYFWRQAGYDIQYLRIYKIGDTRFRGGSEMIKTETGWERVKKVKEVAPLKPTKAKPAPKITSRVINTSGRQLTKNGKEKPFNISSLNGVFGINPDKHIKVTGKPLDPETEYSVRRDSKTVVIRKKVT